MSLKDSGALEKWFVVFQNSAQPVWWQRWLKPGFQHVEAYGWDDIGKRWVIVSPTLDIAVVRAFPPAVFADYLAELHKRGARILLAEAGINGPRRPRFFASCVTVVMALLGIGGVCAVTPFSLYRILRQRGAVEVSGNGRIL